MANNIQQPLKRLQQVCQTRAPDATMINAAKSLLEHNDRSLARFWQAVAACALWFIALALFALMVGCNFSPPRVPRDVPVGRSVDQQNDSAVRIEIACISGDAFTGSMSLSGAYGSGAVIADATVLTANHVVRCAGVSIINVIVADGHKYPATLSYADSSRDYARLRVPGLLSPRKATFAKPRIGEQVCLVTGYPDRLRSCGEILDLKNYSTRDNGTVDMEFDAPIIQGNSGSGIYNGNGDLIGLATNTRGCLIAGECGGLGTSVAGRVE